MRHDDRARARLEHRTDEPAQSFAAKNLPAKRLARGKDDQRAVESERGDLRRRQKSVITRPRRERQRGTRLPCAVDQRVRREVCDGDVAPVERLARRPRSRSHA